MIRREIAFKINELRPTLEAFCDDVRLLEVKGTLGIPDMLLIRNAVPLFVEVKYQDRPGLLIHNLTGAQVNVLNSLPNHSWLLIGFASTSKVMLFRGSEVRYRMKSCGGRMVRNTPKALGMRLTNPTY